jgi:hypothetical protein
MDNLASTGLDERPSEVMKPYFFDSTRGDPEFSHSMA